MCKQIRQRHCTSQYLLCLCECASKSCARWPRSFPECERGGEKEARASEGACAVHLVRRIGCLAQHLTATGDQTVDDAHAGRSAAPVQSTLCAAAFARCPPWATCKQQCSVGCAVWVVWWGEGAVVARGHGTDKLAPLALELLPNDRKKLSLDSRRPG